MVQVVEEVEDQLQSQLCRAMLSYHMLNGGHENIQCQEI